MSTSVCVVALSGEHVRKELCPGTGPPSFVQNIKDPDYYLIINVRMQGLNRQLTWAHLAWLTLVASAMAMSAPVATTAVVLPGSRRTSAQLEGGATRTLVHRPPATRPRGHAATRLAVSVHLSSAIIRPLICVDTNWPDE